MSAVSRDTFETLRTETLAATVPSLPAETFASVASWAVWAEPTPGSADWSRDLSVLAWEQLEPIIHNRVVFVALNKGTTPLGHPTADWANFHSGRSDHKLARAIDQPGVRERLRGAYITDFFKGLPTPSAADLNRYLRALPRLEEERTINNMVALLHREVEILGAVDPLVVAVGSDARRWLDAHLTGFTVVGISHYAKAISHADYAEELARVGELVSPA